MNAPDSKIDTSVPAIARRYDAWLGGKDNFAVDRASAATIRDAFPSITAAVAENRRCLLRTIRYLAGECGVRQFLDIGCGIPDRNDNVHQVAQRIAPDSRIVYVDNDPLVASHARALMCSSPRGAVAVHEADLTRPHSIITADIVSDTLDLTQPVAVLVFAVLHFIPEDAIARTAVQELMAALPTGSYLALSHATFDPLPEIVRASLADFIKPEAPHGPFHPRSREQIIALLTGLELIEPGVVSTVRWRPDLEPYASRDLGEHEVISYAAAARKSSLT